MANFYDILKNVCILAHEELPSSFNDVNDPYPEIKQYIKDTVEEVCSKFPWTFREKKYTFNTVANQREYALASGMLASNILEDSVRIVDYNKPLYFMFHQDLDQLMLSSGKPYRYSIYGSNLILDPTPDSAYAVQIKYLTTNYGLSADGLTEKVNLNLETDRTIIPERYIKTIEWGAYSLYRQNFRPDEKFKYSKNKFIDYILDMQKSDGYGCDASPRLSLDLNDTLNARLIKEFFNPQF